MAKVAVEHVFSGTTQKYSVGYDEEKTLLGKHIHQYTGATALDKFAGPLSLAFARPMEASTQIPVAYPYPVSIENNIHWIFFADNNTAAATRRIVLYEFNETLQTLTWKGFITLTYPSATNHTIRGLAVSRHLHTTGTVTCSGTTDVSGSGTDFVTSRMAAGARIGFGSTNPASIATWYTIATITDGTNIVLGQAGPSVSDVAYVIEELRVYTATTNATAANGGLFVAKGINYNDFATGGTTISAATGTDNLKAVYWLADASTVLNTAATGLALDTTTVTNTNATIYIGNVDASTTLRIYKYNGRATLAGLASGKSTSAFTLRTGQQASLAGTLSQLNATIIATCSHGVASGVKSVYQTSTTRIYRIAEANIVDASTTFISDSMAEIPSGGSGTYAATAGLSNLSYSSSLDRFIVSSNASGRNYITQYADGSEMDYVFGVRGSQTDPSTADSDTVPYPDHSVFQTFDNFNGYLVICKNSTNANVNTIYITPIAADWAFAAGSNDATQNRLITPKMTLSGCRALYKVYDSSRILAGIGNLGVQPEPYRLYYRASGISDNSGSWTLVDDTGILPAVATEEIQFMFEFRLIGTFMIPARIYSVTCIYEDSTTDSHYQPSVAFSDRSNKKFAWRFAEEFGDTVPTLYVRIYNAVTGALLVTDDTATPDGTWEKSTNDGSSWGAYNTTDKANDTTYIRYTPASLGDNIKVSAILSQT